MDEKILVFKRDVIPYLPPFGLFQDEQLLPLALAHMEFAPRSEVETNPAYKQFIPYCILRHGTRLICYRRSSAGSETRLHGLYSIGWGGHVNSRVLLMMIPPMWARCIWGSCLNTGWTSPNFTAAINRARKRWC